LLRACGSTLDWHRLLDRFDANWRVLLAHLVLFEYIYPHERWIVPDWVMNDLSSRRREECTIPQRSNPTCYGTLFSRSQYEMDVIQWGYDDARLPPHGTMTREQIARWKSATD
jgi:hypothetical protein